jgi:hypothetical protein
MLLTILINPVVDALLAYVTFVVVTIALKNFLTHHHVKFFILVAGFDARMLFCFLWEFRDVLGV